MSMQVLNISTPSSLGFQVTELCALGVYATARRTQGKFGRLSPDKPPRELTIQEPSVYGCRALPGQVGAPRDDF